MFYYIIAVYDTQDQSSHMFSHLFLTEENNWLAGAPETPSWSLSPYGYFYPAPGLKHIGNAHDVSPKNWLIHVVSWLPVYDPEAGCTNLSYKAPY